MTPSHDDRPIAVTGAAGTAGRAIVQALYDAGFPVLAIDLVPSPTPSPRSPHRSLLGGLVATIRADLRDLGQTMEVLSGARAVVHMANVPAPGLLPPGVTFVDNVAMNHHVFTAAATLRLERVVWASSETTLGLPFANPPRYAPVDEGHYPLPESSYALSKVVTETMAEQAARWSGIPFVALRFSNILGPDVYRTFPEACWRNVRDRAWNLWGYVDARDAAQATLRALTADVRGARSFVIAAADTVMPHPSRELMAEVFPGVEVAADLPEFGTLLSIERARAELGYEPEHSWRSTLTP
jgi:nucleoside-diphosphate-sugar epimerase